MRKDDPIQEPLKELFIFPLNEVLFPHAILQMHVLDEKHRALIEKCLDENMRVGLVLIREKSSQEDMTAESYMVGTTAKIIKSQNLRNHRIHVHIQGESRFRIRELNKQKELLIGKIEPLHEIGFNIIHSNSSIIEETKTNFIELIKNLFSETDLNVEILFPENSTALSFVIANFLPISLREKQYLLELTNTEERFIELAKHIKKQLSKKNAIKYYPINSNHLTEWIHPN